MYTSFGLWLWFAQERKTNKPINGSILKEKAVILGSELQDGGTKQEANYRWLSHWEKGHEDHSFPWILW